jgi:hypothetical protein
MKYRKISWDEVVKLLETNYKIKDIEFKKNFGYGDNDCYDLPDYIIGEEQ